MFNYKINFNNGATVKLLECDIDITYKIEFIDNDNDNIIQVGYLKSNESISTTIKYYKNWKIVISTNKEILVDYNMNLIAKNIMVIYDTGSLGDTIFITPHVDEFRVKHSCNLYASVPMILSEKSYPNINFIQFGTPIDNIYATYKIGWYIGLPKDIIMNPIDFKGIPIQQVTTDILGLKYHEIRGMVDHTYENGYKRPNYKYVCITQYSTSNAKHWHYPVPDSEFGWQVIVDWLNDNGYKTMVISKQSTKLKNIIDKTGNHPLQERMSQIKDSECFIGVGSGLSWLSWAMLKKTVMISGFSDDFCEFQEDNIRIINKSNCYGCFNKHEFDRGDWDWCPVHKGTNKQYECTTKISPQYIINEIIDNNLIDIKNKSIRKDNIILTINDIDTQINSNRLYVTFKKDIPYVVGVNIKNEFGDRLFVKQYDNINKGFTQWFEPYNQPNIYYIEIYSKHEKLLELNHII